jgi:urease gamma subunit
VRRKTSVRTPRDRTHIESWRLRGASSRGLQLNHPEDAEPKEAVMTRLVGQERYDAQNVGDIMTRPPRTLDVTASVMDAATAMREGTSSRKLQLNRSMNAF